MHWVQVSTRNSGEGIKESLVEGIEDFFSVKYFYKSKTCKNFEVGIGDRSAEVRGWKIFLVFKKFYKSKNLKKFEVG